MSIKKVLTDIGTDVPMEHHIVSSANCQYENNQTYVIVRSFFSQASYQGGKRALAETPVLMMGYPASGVDLLDWVQAQLVLPVDDALSVSTYVNRWQFSGGEVIDRAPAVSNPTAATPTPSTIPTPADVVVESPAAPSADEEATQAPAPTETPAASDPVTPMDDSAPTGNVPEQSAS